MDKDDNSIVSNVVEVQLDGLEWDVDTEPDTDTGTDTDTGVSINTADVNTPDNSVGIAEAVRTHASASNTGMVGFDPEALKPPAGYEHLSLDITRYNYEGVKAEDALYKPGNKFLSGLLGIEEETINNLGSLDKDEEFAKNLDKQLDGATICGAWGAVFINLEDIIRSLTRICGKISQISNFSQNKKLQELYCNFKSLELAIIRVHRIYLIAAGVDSDTDSGSGDFESYFNSVILHSIQDPVAPIFLE